jgi:3'-phosphoadenosine 5'-phosphosulfate sulfotransferase (PAPS reductase)/FAD synthetase
MFSVRKVVPTFRLATRAGPAAAPAANCIRIQWCGFAVSPALQAKVDGFKKAIETHLPKDGKNVVFATAWLATDNVFVALMAKHFPEVLKGMNLVAIDTMHLFPTTLTCAELVQKKYGKQALWKAPADVTTLEEFNAKYGDCEEMDSADFDG